MTTLERDQSLRERFQRRSPSYLGRRPPDVVAVLSHDGSAKVVAATAVREAVRRRAAVRFLQLAPARLDADEAAAADDATFRAGLRALHGHPRTPSTFELVVGDPTRLLVARSRTAMLLVVADHREDVGAMSLSEFCRHNAACSVAGVTWPQ